MKPNIGAGDKGKTNIIGCCLDKTSPIISLLGHLDELNSYIGFSRSLLAREGEKLNIDDLDKIMKEIQSHIFLISSELAGAKLKEVVGEKEVKWLEDTIRKLEAELEPISHFVYTSGSMASASLQVARAVCRRVEIKVFRFSKKERIVRNEILSYLNRLSDVLFTLARVVNKRMGFKEELWKVQN
ncbi:MAG: cob(I)yrinic acid a,c-diamide adenosyltransferase [Candidatus Aenigmarchaeota archaeon]|jgi:cob(I)alamin adenosyltransferase|nr:cob(I)yrinic acid a,c-diamide adenosyltransferase [Candidatus Aenigmarchaeota archaeon]